MKSGEMKAEGEETKGGGLVRCFHFHFFLVLVFFSGLSLIFPRFLLVIGVNYKMIHVVYCSNGKRGDGMKSNRCFYSSLERKEEEWEKIKGYRLYLSPKTILSILSEKK